MSEGLIKRPSITSSVVVPAVENPSLTYGECPFHFNLKAFQKPCHFSQRFLLVRSNRLYINLSPFLQRQA